MQHVKEICDLAIDVRDKLATFAVPQSRGETLQIRIGIHT